MNELIEFLTSKEIIVVYIVAGIACLLCFIIYLIDKNYTKRKQRQNTRELNKLVEEVSEYISTEEIDDSKEEINKEPIIEQIEEVTTYKANHNQVQEVKEKQIEELEIEELALEEKEEVIEPVENIVLETMQEPVKQEVIKEEEELQYTSIEPDEATAKLELQKLAEELEKAEAATQNIELTSYEEEQESNAIISLEELVKKSKEMYEANEITQYADEGNEPISLADLERKMQETAPEYNEPFIIENVVEEIKPEEISEMLETEPTVEQIHLDDFNTVKVENKVEEIKITENKPAYQTDKKFQSSPVISPIYGIERKETTSNIELENTANYDKLDEEIKKTNEFLMTLKELQKNLD